MKTRKELFELVKSFRENGFILANEAKVFKDLIVVSNEDGFNDVEDLLFEVAENSSGLLADINKLAELIYPTFENRQEAIDFAKDNSTFSQLEFVNFSVFEILERNPEYVQDSTPPTIVVAHIVATVKYEGKEYGFGFNSKQKAVSYKKGDKGPFYDNISANITEYNVAIKMIKHIIQYIMGAM